jgi:iron(III) transport system substrate-binding protein
MLLMRTILNFSTSVLCFTVLATALAACSPQGGDKTSQQEASQAGPGEKQAGSAGQLNLYSARHYDADEQLYAFFEKDTGIKINRLEMKGDLLLERLKAEGSRSPADVVLMVDAGNFWKAENEGLFQPINSTVLNAAIPAHLRDDKNMWFGFAKRARVIAYDKAKFTPDQVGTYEALGNPALKGAVCSRPSSNIYNLSLMGALMKEWGNDKAEAWAKSVVANFARSPEGGDTDQLTAIADGKCGVAIVNHYYAVRMQRSDNAAEKAASEAFALSFPEQAGFGTHINISGAAVASNAPNKANAVVFLEFLATPAAQKILADANDEFPVLATAAADNAALKAYSGFKEAQTPLSVLGENQAEAQKIYDRAGWK